VNRHCSRVERSFVAPDAIHQLLPGEHFAWVRCEEEEQVELLAGQPHGLPGKCHLTCPSVDGQLVERDRLRNGLCRHFRTLEDITDADRQLPRGERLGDIVVGTELESDDAIGGLTASGQHDHGQGTVGADPAAKGEPVRAGKHHVEHDEVGSTALDDRSCGIPVGRLECVEAVALQVAHDDVAHDRLVVDDEDGGHRAHCRCPRAHLAWWCSAQSLRTEPEIIPRSEWLVAG